MLERGTTHGVGENPRSLIGQPFQAQFQEVTDILTAHAVSHEGLANNHEICNPRFGHGVEPKIFWVRESGQGSQRRTRFSADLDPDG